MIKTCQHCGAVNGEPTEICCFCDAPLNPARRPSASRRVATPTEDNLAIEPEWRREVSSRLRAYRVRRHGSAVSDIQTALPFEAGAMSPVQTHDSDSDAETEFISTAAPVRQRKPRTERYEISIHEPSPDGAAFHRQAASQSHDRTAPDSLFPVESLPERRRAALLDTALLVFSYGGMLTLFMALGGRLGFNKVDAAVTGATLALFYAQYFALFTIFGGSTPGMMLRGIRVATFDGRVPTSRQMAWRSFGYLISAGTLFLGFLWALWDDDHLCWHDRISQTYLTPRERFTSPESSQENSLQS